MGLILEHQQPILILPVNLGVNMDRTSIDLLALIQLRQQATLFQHLCTDGCDVHERLRTDSSFFFAVNLNSCSQIALISSLHCRIIDLYFVQVGREGGMSAVVRPVSIHHTHFSDGGIPVLFVTEICLQELKVIQIHSKAKLIQQRAQTSFIQADKPIDSSYRLRGSIFYRKGFRLFKGCLPAFNSIDHMLFDSSNVCIR